MPGLFRVPYIEGEGGCGSTERTLGRPATQKESEVRMTAGIPKPHTKRCARYLRWIRTLGCVVCGKRSEAAHVGPHGLSIRTDDWRALPICHHHHQTARESLTALGHEKFGEFYGLNMLDQVIQHLMRYLEEQVQIGDNLL